jgi:hypothetical protein
LYLKSIASADLEEHRTLARNGMHLLDVEKIGQFQQWMGLHRKLCVDLNEGQKRTAEFGSVKARDRRLDHPVLFKALHTLMYCGGRERWTNFPKSL